jgi:predicted ATP-grasp superfamily ATP-dependent carboligase
MKNSAALPPVFVMNTYYTGIGIARNLHRYGVDVHGLCWDADAPGIRSRFFKGIYPVPNGRDEPEALCERLIELRRRHEDAPVIFPTRDFDVMFLHNHRRELSSLYRLPQDFAVDRLLDKHALFEIAMTRDIPVPQTAICSSIEEIAAQLPGLRFPLVVKPRIAAQWRQKAAWKAVGARKAFLVENAEELRTEYLRISAVSPEVMIQEYVHGSDCDIAVYCCFVNTDHQIPAYFTARKLRQNPPLFGTGCAVETTDIPEIVPIAERLLEGVGYTGIAEVEFKRDASVGKWFLIEVNPRHWDQHEIGAHVGVNLSWIAYQHMIGQPLDPQVPAQKEQAQLRWIAETESLMLVLRNAYVQVQENRRLSGSFRQRVKGYFEVLRSLCLEIAFLLRGRKVFAIFHRRDPLPGVLLCLRTARELCHLLAQRLTSHSRIRHATE